MTEHSLADNLVLMTYSEFGRSLNENSSNGTDHGAASALFIVGNPVKGGLFGAQPSLNPSDFNSVGNVKFTTDFRSVYATILDRWHLRAQH